MRLQALVVVSALALLSSCSERVEQPIPFNHRLHVEKNELACDFCHETVASKPFAGIPRVEVCIGCHEGDVTTNPAAEPHIALIRHHADAGTEIPWKRIYQLPHHVYYSHQRHVTLGKLECATCHGDIAKSERPPGEPVENTLSMDHCIACHVKRGVESECAWCHR
ncbi:MAG: cytochrome c3 family protein [Myxococcaceae bacterium]